MSDKQCLLADHKKCVYCESFRECYKDEIMGFRALPDKPSTDTYTLRILYEGPHESVYTGMSVMFAAALADTLLKNSTLKILEINITKEANHEQHTNDQRGSEPQVDAVDAERGHMG